jgi:formylglycine-generating enzyme required for sulfatase activity
MGVPAGSFMMGESSSSHKVTLTKGFWIGWTEVTQAQWKAVIGNNPSYFQNCDNCPVEQVSWEDVQQFIQKLNARGEGTYRLPTEAEWEYAARSGTTGDYAGNVDSMGWYSANSGSRTHEVAINQPNAWGLYDMHGNVWEWVQDWYGDYPGGSVTNPTGATSGSHWVARGGSFDAPIEVLRSAIRGTGPPSYRAHNLGFRVLRIAN